MYYLGDFANFSEITDEDRARSRKYGRRGALIGGLTTIPNLPGLALVPGGLGAKIVGAGLGAGINAGTGYLIGKGISRMMRGADNPKGKKGRNRKNAEYSQNVNYTLFKRGEQPVKKKRNWLRTGAKVATVGALGLGAASLGMGGLIHTQNKVLKKTGEQNIKSKVKSAFDTLGVGETSNMKDVKKAYRNASMKSPQYKHPDVGGTREGFEKLNNAYDYVKPDGVGRIKDVADLQKQQDTYKKARNMYFRGGGKLAGVGAVGVGGLMLTKPKREKEQKPNRLQQLINR